MGLVKVSIQRPRWFFKEQIAEHNDVVVVVIIVVVVAVVVVVVADDFATNCS